MQVKYIANHIKTDSIPGIGLRWEPGQVREVTSTVGEQLLTYSDTWVEVKDRKKSDAREVEPEDAVDLRTEQEEPEEPLAIVDFHAMDKAKLLKYAEDNWNWRPNRNWSEGVIRERVIKRHTEEQMDGNK